MKTLVLDAMGVIYAAGDDVAELLCPFIHERGGVSDDERIKALYREASRGQISAVQFWEQVGVDPRLEDDYLSHHRLSAGALEFLQQARPSFASLWCLSNDVSEWSRKLRKRFDLGRFIEGFVISGDVGARKPDPAIFKHLLAQTRAAPQDILFVDDRPANLDAAAALGLQTILFGSAAPGPGPHGAVANFTDLFHHAKLSN